MHRRLLPSAIAALSLVAIGCDIPTGPTEPATSPQAAPAQRGMRTTHVIPGRYIVLLRNDLDEAQVNDVRAGLAEPAVIDRIYTGGLKGFAGAISDADAVRLANDPRVAVVEADRMISLAVSISRDAESERIPWGIAKVGGPGDGTGRVAWIIDTGIDLDHPELRLDVARSRTFARGTSTPDDGNGHGTHVAGTIAALDDGIGVSGVAAGATVVAIRVFDDEGAGTYSDIVAGIDYAAAAASRGDVVNMSLGGPISPALDHAVLALASRGVRVIVAAGNDGASAAACSPAHVDAANVFTVSAIGPDGCLAEWSNDGPSVDYAAPGVAILSTWKGGGSRTISGTSMAAPHVAALLLLGAIDTSGVACGDRDGIPDPVASRAPRSQQSTGQGQ